MRNAARSVLVVAITFLVVWVVGLAWWIENYATYEPCGLTATEEEVRQLAEETGCDIYAPRLPWEWQHP